MTPSSLPRPVIFVGWLQILLLASLQPAYSNPQSPTVVAGSVHFQGGAGQLNISQSSSHAIVNWQNFSIDQGELTRFIQPGANSAILNRVVSGNPSAIHGQLQANGQVFLINPNGILVGPSGQIDTAGFLASTLDVSNAEFLAGGDMNFTGDSNASIVNLGTINAIDGGDIFLLSRTIVNEGTLNAEGNVGLGAGSKILLKADGDERIAILPEGQSGSISNKGVVEGAIAELKAAGGNQYALAIKNDGMVRAKGFQKRGGKLYLSAGGGRVSNSGTLKATERVEVKGPEVENTGTIDASNDEGVGGTVVLLGEKVELGSGSLIIADGATDGGDVYIGGGPRGEAIADENNAQFTSAAAGSRIEANGADGRGGTVILWADDTMDYQGHIENTGTTSGGFAEVSGLRHLSFAGTVNTGGGDLLLDPFNYTIGATEAGNIVTALGANNVTIDTTADTAGFGSSGNAADAGDITVNSDIFYDSTFDLTFLAVGDANFNASVQNRNATGGDINIVAGWDGTTAFDATTFLAEDVATTTLFGQNSGSVYLGDGSQTTAIAVGSRAGATNVFGYDLGLTGGSSAANLFSQLGFFAAEGVGLTGADLGGVAGDGSDDIITGSLSALTVHDITLQGGSFRNSSAQIGHLGIAGGNRFISDANTNADITITAGSNLSLLAGPVSNSYAQLGHGGNAANGNHNGDIFISVIGNDLLLDADAGFGAYSQIGHGGYSSTGDTTGDIFIGSVGNDLTINPGTNILSYGQVGHGGAYASGNRNGDITVQSTANNLRINGGSYFQTYGQLGHGGYGADGSYDGDISLTGGNIYVTGIDMDDQFALIGHGDELGDSDAGSSVTGDITVYANIGSADVTNGWIGHLLDADGTLNSGAMTLMAQEDITLSNLLASGGYDTTSTYSYLAGENVNFNASVQNRNATGGDINIVAGWDGATAFHATTFLAEDVATTSLYGQNSGSVNIGDGAQTTGIAVGSRSGATNVFGYDLNLIGSDSTNSAFAQLGFRVSNGVALDGFDLDSGSADGANVDVNGGLSVRMLDNINASGGAVGRAYVQLGHIGRDFSGNNLIEANTNSVIDVSVGGDINVEGGEGFSAYAQLGHGGYEATGNHSGDITIHSANNLIFTGGGRFATYAQLGNGGFEAIGNHSGDITIVQANDLSFSAGSSRVAYAHLGHGGTDSRGNFTGDITITQVDNELTFTAGSGGESYGQLGHGGYNADGDQSGNIMIGTVGSNVTFSAGDYEAYAQLGHGGFDAQGTHRGTISLGSVGDLTFNGGSAEAAYAQLGHGGKNANGDATGTITIVDAGAITFAVGSGDFASARLGHGGEGTPGNHGGDNDVDPTLDGDITITAADSLTFTAAAGNASFAQLGHGGYSANRSHTGDIMIGSIAGDVVATGGGGSEGYAQIGHGGYGVTGNHSGSITIENVGNDLILTAGSDNVSFAQIGHGGYSSRGDHSGAITISAVGNDFLVSGGSDNVTYGQVGHGGGFSTGNYTGAITIGSVGSRLAFSGGSNFANYAQLGHGGYNADGNHGGAISISSAGSDFSFSAGSSFGSYAQLGHGGHGVDGNFDGNITVSANGAIDLTGINLDQYARIGHGDVIGDSDGGFSVEGDISVIADSDLTLTNAELGHQIDADGTYTSGNTYIGVARDFSADVMSRFDSAASGELRIYLADPSFDFFVNDAAQFNGVAHGPDFAPNNQGTAAFGFGTYAPGTSATGGATVAGNFNYYTLEDQGLYNYIVESIEATNITSALNNGSDITLAFDLKQEEFGALIDIDGGTQFIRIDDDIFNTSNQYLNLITTGDIHLNASLQNSHIDGGDLNIVAGFDGANASSTFDAATFLAADVSNTALFGLNEGSIRIGNGNQTAAIAVGSRTGATNAFGYDLSLRGASDGIGRFAQLGFKANNGVGLNGDDLGGIANSGIDDFITGDITALAINDITARGGTSVNDLNYAQIGHVGAEIASVAGSEAHADASITVAAGNDLTLQAGEGDLSYTQVGHGGVNGAGDHSGTIAIDLVGNDLTLTSGEGVYSYSQIGHGGLSTYGDIDGSITISSVGNDLNLISTNGDSNAYTQIGHGGTFSDGIREGGIDIGSVGNNLNLGGATSTSYSQIGHGGFGSDGRNTGDISIDSIGAGLNATGGTINGAYVQLGHGGGNSAGSSSGGITLSTAANIYFSGGSNRNAYAQFGHGGFRADGNLSGGILISDVGDVSFLAGSVAQAYAQLGHGGGGVSGVDVSGDIAIDNAGDITLTAGTAADTYAQLGNGGQDSDSSYSGNITLTDVGDIAVTAGTGGGRYAKIGLGGGSSNGTRDGDVTIIGAGDITLSAGLSPTGRGATAVIGHASNGAATGSQTGNILIQDVGDLLLSGGANSNNFAMIGLGGTQIAGHHVGDISINQAGDITLLTQSDGGENAFAQIGIALVDESSAGSSATGQITISDAGDISLSSSGSWDDIPTQIGHGGLNSTGDLSGDISITDFGSLSLAAGTGDRSYSQVGHGGWSSGGNIDGSITISAAGPIDLVGVDLDQYARIGHGDGNSDSDAGFSVEGDVSVRTTSSLTLTQAEIGHQIDADGTYTSGNTFIGVGTAGGTETLTADAASRFDSAPGGELRFYIPSAASNQIAAGAFLNGTAATGPGITPNDQGEYEFGEGPYVLTDPGNFAFYTYPEAVVTNPDTSTPGTSTPDTSTPDTSTPDTSTPGTSTPGTSTPGTSTPGTSTPGTSTPGTSTPGTSTPGTSTPGTSIPGTDILEEEPEFSGAFAFLDFQSIRPVSEDFEHRNQFLFPAWTGATMQPLLLGAVPHQYETLQFTSLFVNATEGLFRNAAGDFTQSGVFTTTLGASVILSSDGSFVYDPTPSEILSAGATFETEIDTFTYRIYSGEGEITGFGTVSILVKKAPEN